VRIPYTAAPTTMGISVSVIENGSSVNLASNAETTCKTTMIALKIAMPVKRFILFEFDVIVFDIIFFLRLVFVINNILYNIFPKNAI
jgi:hypothetical protein